MIKSAFDWISSSLAFNRYFPSRNGLGRCLPFPREVQKRVLTETSPLPNHGIYLITGLGVSGVSWQIATARVRFQLPMSMPLSDGTKGMMTRLFLFLSLLVFTAADAPGRWGYDVDNGPLTWGKSYEMCGSGKSQSPINIVSKGTIRHTFLRPLSFDEYDEDVSDWMVQNLGTSVKITSNTSKAEFSGGCMKDKTYALTAIHFHWGSTDNKGSEHRIDGVGFPLEMHLVHYNTEYNAASALNYKDGLSVLTIFYKIVKKDNDKIAPFIDSLRHLEEPPDTEKVKKSVTLKELLPLDRTFYFCYEGSLTTPACNEGVTWTLFGQPSEISEEQLEVLRALKSRKGKRLVDNYRPLQPLNGRPVYMKGDASVISTTSLLICFATYVSLAFRMT